MTQKTIDINCDMGESFGRYLIGNDRAILPYITSANIACGFHGGDPLHIQRTIRGAIEHDVAIGAHPGFPDLQGFGRRPMQLNSSELGAVLQYQISAVKGMSEAAGGQLTYVKPHGALYNMAASDTEMALTIAQAIHAISDELVFLGLAGSVMEQAAHQVGLRFAAEAFADRRYTADGRLVSRAQSGAVIQRPEDAVGQILEIIQNERVLATNGTGVMVKADSICIHGDNPTAPDILQAIDAALVNAGIVKKAFA